MEGLLFVLICSGTIFSGFMSYEKYFEERCLFDEPCPLFLGKPACYFGFTMFLCLFLLGLRDQVISRTKPSSTSSSLLLIFWLSLIGTCFAFYFVIVEARTHSLIGRRFGMSTCFWGMFFFLLICILSSYIMRRTKRSYERS